MPSATVPRGRAEDDDACMTLLRRCVLPVRIAGGKALTLKLRLRVDAVPKRVGLRASAADAAGNRATAHRSSRIARVR
jgi:hypothetical protein